jgi:hypothetical protein
MPRSRRCRRDCVSRAPPLCGTKRIADDELHSNPNQRCSQPPTIGRNYR